MFEDFIVGNSCSGIHISIEMNTYTVQAVVFWKQAASSIQPQC